MHTRLDFLINRLAERLWVRPLAFCVLSVAGAFLAKIADWMDLADFVPTISPDSIEKLLSVVAASMLVIATFSVASMVSAYASAASSGTPRTFPLIVADDVSQNALSVFIGAFIFSIVALVALLNGYYGKAGHFALFVLTLAVFAWVVLTFVRWVDKIARLGRLGNTVEKVEQATESALESRLRNPSLGGVPVDPSLEKGAAITDGKIGYVQHIEVAALQKCAEENDLRITIAALPGTFVTPDKPLLYCAAIGSATTDFDRSKLTAAFQIGGDRVFEDDPRFGLVVLSEIAGRALSPAVNDPGTAIAVVGTLLRLFSIWVNFEEEDAGQAQCGRVAVPGLSIQDMFDDAFTAIGRDGADSIEVQMRLQKALAALALMANGKLADAARRHSRMALVRAKNAMTLPADIELVAAAAAWADE